jgi:hypothetical protein
VYYKADAKRPQAKAVEVILSASHIESEMSRIDKTAQEIAEARRSIVKAMELPGNSDACHAYGGCPYREMGVCTLSAQERVKGFVMSTSMKERMLAAKAAKQGQAQVVAINPPPIESPVAVEAEVISKPKPNLSKFKKPAAVEVVPERKVEIKAPAKKISVLYINCAPSSMTGVVRFGQVLEYINAEITERHYRLIPNLYGGAPGVLAQALEQAIEEGQPLVIDTRITEAGDALAWLEANATEIVRGF